MGWLIKVFLLIFVISLFGLWFGFDAIRVSYYSSDLATFNIKEIEQNGVGDKRYIKIDKAFWDGSMVYKAKVGKNQREIKPDSPISEVIIPIMSSDELNSQLENKNSKVKVLVKYYLPNETKLENLDTWLPDDKVKATDEFSVSGVTLVGFDSIDSESQRLISSLKHEISNDVIFLRAGDKPNPLTFGFIILGISLIGTILPPFASYKIYIWNKYGRPSESDPTPLNLNSK